MTVRRPVAGCPVAGLFLRLRPRAGVGRAFPSRETEEGTLLRCCGFFRGRGFARQAGMPFSGGLKGSPCHGGRAACAACSRHGVAGTVGAGMERAVVFWGGRQGKGQPGGCPLCEGRAWRNARQDQLEQKVENSLQRYVKKLLMARCQSVCPQRKMGGPAGKAACRAGCPEKA